MLLRTTALLGTLFFGLLCGQAYAQTYPSQPIRIVVPLAPGGVADIVARMLAQKFNESGTTAVVENKTGAGGAIAGDFVAKSEPNGYTILLGYHGINAILPHLQRLTFDPQADLRPITIAAKTPNILTVHPSVAAKSVAELISLAKANPKTLTFASQGNGSSGHLVAEQFKQIADIDLAHVPYRGSAPAAQDLIAGHVTMLFDSLTTALPHVNGGSVRALAIADSNRSALLPDIPTFAEAGLPALESGAWFGFFVPRNTPPNAVDWLYKQISNAFRAADIQEQFKARGMTAVLASPEATSDFVTGEFNRWGNVIRSANITLN